jgi:hypothetical protein
MVSFLVFLLFSQKVWSLSPSVPEEDLKFENVVSIALESYDKTGSVVGLCNATLVSPQLAVTAAHCLSESWLSHISLVHLKVGKYKYVKRFRDGKTVRIGYVNFYDATVPATFFFTQALKNKMTKKFFNEIPPDQDVAVIRFEKPLPLDPDFSYASILPRLEFQKLKGSLPPNTFAAVSVNPIAEISTTDTKRIAYFNDVKFQGNLLRPGGWFVSHSLARVEGADSGSPIFTSLNNTLYLAAVVKGEAHTVLASWDVFSPVTNLCQIASENNLDSKTFCP